MSTFIVKGPDTFLQLIKSFSNINQKLPIEIDNINRIIEEFFTNIQIDQKETEAELLKLKEELKNCKNESISNDNKKTEQIGDNNDKNSDKENDLNKKIERLERKKQELANAVSSYYHILTQFRQIKNRTNQLVIDSKKGESALNEFYKITLKYIGLSSVSSDHRPKKETNISTEKIYSAELLGDTLHINKKNHSVQQKDIDSAINEVKSINMGNKEVNKISFSDVSQLSFSLLEKNGFTIQEIEPNKFSAYKEI